MIDYLDNLLCDLLLAEVDGLADEVQVRYQPPDEDWRTGIANLTVGGQSAIALNIYLVDLRENRKIRSNERVRNVDENGFVSEKSAPAQFDCHYPIRAWSPAQASAEGARNDWLLFLKFNGKKAVELVDKGLLDAKWLDRECVIAHGKAHFGKAGNRFVIITSEGGRVGLTPRSQSKIRLSSRHIVRLPFPERKP
jgi:hypothetical protein